MEFGQQFRNFRRELGSFSCPKAGTWERLFYFPSEEKTFCGFFQPEKSDGFGRERTRDLEY
jgi:hypothetical protein